MPDPVSRPTPAEVAAIAAAVDRDEQRPGDERAREDQRLAPSVLAAGPDPVRAGLCWLEQVLTAQPDLAARLHRVRSALTGARLLVLVAGALLGWVTTLGVFYYDGSGRVNVVAVLAALVALPALLLIPFVLANLPARIRSALPGAGPLAAAGEALSPGRLGSAAIRLLPRDWRESWSWWQGRVDAHRTVYGSMQKWLVLLWSQAFAVAFQVAAVLTAVSLVVFTDLAFGWSTTLTSGSAADDARRVHGIASAMATPWAWAVPDAQPGLGLIQESRYYRIAAGPASPEEAARLGGWWRFVILALLIYGLLPRLLALLVARHRLRGSVRAAIAETPGLTTVLRRLHRAAVHTSAMEAEPPGTADMMNPSPAADSPAGLPEISHVINWAAVPVDDADLSARFGGAKVHAAGGGAALEADNALAARLAAELPDGAGLAIAVKAWEPPLLDFADFIRALRQALGHGRPIIVVPVAADGGTTPSSATPAQSEVWRRQLNQVGDPWLRVGAPTPEDRP